MKMGYCMNMLFFFFKCMYVKDKYCNWILLSIWFMYVEVEFIIFCVLVKEVKIILGFVLIDFY